VSSLSEKKVEIAIAVDLNQSMTTLSPLKRLSAAILTIVLTNIFTTMNIRTKHFVFGDRNAIWRLCSESSDEIDESDESEDVNHSLNRLLAVLYSGG
jgi:hypothetical protein